MKFTLLFFSLLLSITQSYAADGPFDDYKMKEYTFNGHDARIVFPKEANADRYWIWRARFWGHEPQLDRAMLERGFHIVYVDVAGLFGNDEAVQLWNEFYDSTVARYNLNAKAVLEGMSRGGLIVYNWASQNTDKVICIYADAPVCDIKSWPGGLYAGVGSPRDWQQCLKAYNLNEETVLSFKGIPLYTCVPVAKAGIPVIHVCGDADDVVPFDENTKILAEHFRAAGGKIEIILKPGVGHHPHSLEDPTPLATFILKSIENEETDADGNRASVTGGEDKK